MSLKTEINEVIENRRKRLNISKSKLAELMGLKPSYIGKLLNNEDEHRWNVEQLEKAFEALGIKVIFKNQCRRPHEKGT